MMVHYANELYTEQCSCGRGTRLVRCHDCFQHPTTCRWCFAEQHRQSPFHWALVWDPERHHFEKLDYSCVLPDDFVVQLGHQGGLELCDGALSSGTFYVVHTNGIHASKFRFCECPRASDKLTQLMNARLFPATTSNPKTAFTFAVLREYSMHNIQSKCGAFDFMLSLRCLTDNVFPECVPVSQSHLKARLKLIRVFKNPYKSLLRVSRIWEYLTTKKRVGQLHGIDSHLPHRPTDNITLYCPACPERGVNVTGTCDDLAEELRYVHYLNLRSRRF